MVKRILFWALVVLVALGSAAAIVFGCGTERWAVKTSADQDAQRVNFTPEVTTVHVLTNLPAPSRKELDAHPDTRFPAELKTYTVTAFLVGYKLESDEDFHVVIADPSTPLETMIVEMPSENCVPVSISTASHNLRGTWQHRFGIATKRFKRVPPQKIKLEITGVGLFDFLHGQTGVAPNGFELHRVLSWKEVK